MKALGWFRQDCNCLRAPEVVRLSRTLGIPATHALGIITAIEAQLSAYAPDGDLSYVPDMLSVWAQWQGDADDFAATFIKAVADNECRMRSWIERNEASRKAAENNRQRQQRHRTKQSAPRTAPDNG